MWQLGLPDQGKGSACHRDATVPSDWSEPMRDLLMVILAILVVLDVRILMSEGRGPMLRTSSRSA